ncbi:DUF7344 domain-containing protein [Haloarchaeobius sp. HRN-SO-5]|uniref:DUF7344 domain-containing protein n=1 Tax=Haloarchaeobius sp. HRN-SO-5 TaxID=3446118 RepID=UPI003EBE1FE7
MNDNDTLNTVHDTLACAYRRRILEYLVAAEDDVVEIEELKEGPLGHDEFTEDRGRAAVKLHHVTLPKLATRGFIEYDHRSRTIRYRESPVLERELRRSTDAPGVA